MALKTPVAHLVNGGLSTWSVWVIFAPKYGWIHPVTHASIIAEMSQNVGSIQQVIGPVVDISFPSGMALPKILEALEVEREGQPPLVMECQKHIGEDTVRAIAMDATEGLRRGMPVNRISVEVLSSSNFGAAWWISRGPADSTLPPAMPSIA